MTVDYLIRPVVSEADLAEVRRLVTAHADARATTPGVEFVRADAAGLPGPYLAPPGGLWLAASGAVGLGCVALRPLSADAAEVKRMFVDASARGRGVGRALMRRVIDEARTRGYHALRLGTLDDMDVAQRLYQSLGFVPIERYRLDELIDTRFYELRLDAV
jgi:putative acetyltransferase